MRKRTSKWIAALTALALVPAAAACAKGGGGGNATGIEPDFSLADTLTVDWMIPTQDTLAVDQTPMIQYLAKKFNVTFDVKQQQPSQHDQKVDLLIGNKNIPTMLTRISVARANEYGSYGAFLNFAPYLDDMPNVKALIEDAIEENPNNRAVIYDDEGRIYRIPNYTPNPYPIYNFSYNKAAFTEVGYAEPKTWTEVTAALGALKAKYPSSYPFAVRKTDEGMSMTLNDFVISYTKGYANAQEFYGYDPKSDSFRLSLEIDGYKEAVRTFAELYGKGLVDPEFNSMDGDALMTKIEKRQTFMTCDFNGGYSGFSANEEQTKELWPLHLPSPTENAADASYGFLINNFDVKAGTAIDGNVTKDPVMLGRLLQIVDYMYSDEFVDIQWYHPDVTEGAYPAGSGEKPDPTTYEYALTDGRKTYKPDVYEKSKLGDITNNYFNWSVYANFYNLNDPVCNPVTHAPFYAFRKQLIENKDKYVTVPTPIMTAKEYKQVTAKNALVKNRFETLIYRYMTKSFSDAEWKTLVDDLNNEGGDSLIEVYNEAYRRSENA